MLTTAVQECILCVSVRDCVSVFDLLRDFSKQQEAVTGWLQVIAPSYAKGVAGCVAVELHARSGSASPAGART